MSELNSSHINLEPLFDRLQGIALRPERRLRAQLGKIKKRLARNEPVDRMLAKFEQDLGSAEAFVQARASQPLSIQFDDSLPVCTRVSDIAELIQANQVVVIAGETGSGKTTQLPKILLQAGFGLRGQIAHTQPRRIAARSVAARIAEELAVELGSAVGYQVRFTDESQPNTRVKLMTDGILLAEIQRDPELLAYDAIIIDEAHERSLNIDFLLGYLKNLLPKRPDLKIIITSATIDLERFSSHFNNAPVIEVSGRSFPVDMIYRPWAEEAEEELDAIVQCVEEINRESKGQGDILVFLSGERDIRECARSLKNAKIPHLDILPLYARLSIAEQNKVFAPHKGQRVVLSTNVAETSLTVPGIRYVIDPGKARISRYSLRTKVQRLPIEAISQASANQRAGRCGRVGPGTCYRLYSEEDFSARPEFSDPEILRTNLASVILQMLKLRIGDIQNFPFVDAPERRMINDGFALLEELKAVDKKGEITELGKAMSQLNVDPRYAKMLLSAEQFGCLNEALTIVSGLSVQDPRERPQEKQQASDEMHRRFKDEKSDFVAYLNLWNYLEQKRQELSSTQFRKMCQKEFLHYMRVREWRELHYQLKLSLKQLKLSFNQNAASYESVHRALLSGLLTNVGLLSEDEKKQREYQGTRNKKFKVFPASGLKKSRTKWLMAAEFIETSQLFAHCAAEIDVAWLLEASDHVLKRHYYEPHYQKRSGQVVAFMRSTLWGLVVADKQRKPYGKIEPELSREIFIRSALVEGQYTGKGKFYSQNQTLINDVLELEAKLRRRDLLVDDETLFRFYDSKLPEAMYNLAGFEKWRKQIEQTQPKLLCLSREDLMLNEAGQAAEAQFPNQLKNGDLIFPLEYRFEPGHENDGVNMRVPADLLHQLKPQELEWLVPGLLREKCIAMVKALPKSVRKNLVPVPDYVDRAIACIKDRARPLSEALAQALQQVSGREIETDCWSLDKIDDFYRVNIIVCDVDGKALAQGRDYEPLRERFRDQVQASLQNHGNELEREDVQSWDLGQWQESVEVKRGAVKVKAFPALKVEGAKLAIRLQDNLQEARFTSSKGLRQLAMMALGETGRYARRDLLRGKDLGLTMVNIGSREEVASDILLAAIQRCCFSDLDFRSEFPVRDKAAFDACVEAGRSEIFDTAKALEGTLLNNLRTLIEIRKQIKATRNALALAFTHSDINTQISALFYKGFLQDNVEYFEDYTRYLQAILHRLEKAAARAQKERLQSQEVQGFWQQHCERLEREGPAAYFANREWQHYRWMIEEYRVSCFAQNLKTRFSVSEKRLRAQWRESL